MHFDIYPTFYKFQTLTNVRRASTAAAPRPIVTTYLTATTARVRQVTPVMALPVQVIHAHAVANA